MLLRHCAVALLYATAEIIDEDLGNEDAIRAHYPQGSHLKAQAEIVEGNDDGFEFELSLNYLSETKSMLGKNGN
ncbi:hypothetical protein QE152_g11414 [Popillia japonica]|uniref:Uncharacterized protein n=1 Tax=Popillia japonica TaxID=7064 RepID=A0AAW1LS43_POPJA